MKRFFRILSKLALAILVLLLVLWILIQTPFFQTWLGHTAAKRLSKSLKTTVRVGHVNLRLFNYLDLEGVYVEDRHKDTMLSAGLMQVNITDWFFAKDSADLKYIKLKDVKANLYRNDSVWNYQFIADFFGGSKKKDTSTQGIALHLKVVDLENIHILQSDKWRGKYMVASIGKLHMEANQISFKKSIFDIESLVVEKPEYREFKRPGLWTAADSIAYWARSDAARLVADTTPKDINPRGTFFRLRSVVVKDGELEFYNKQRVPSDPGVFDSRDIVIQKLNGSLKNVLLEEDTLTAKVDLQANERSGIELKKLKTSLRVTPHIIELATLDLQMNDSHVGDYYAMHFHSLDDMDEFIDSIKITANFQNSTVSMKDIGFFAPLLKTKNQVVQLAGDATGTISNFYITDLDLKTKESHITGTYSMVGLTDIDKTIINFQTAGSQIALNDVAVWAPNLLSLKNTPVGQLGVVTYKGNYMGTVYDFAAKGTLVTAVGSMDADFKLKMDGPNKGYSGVVSNARFDGGKLLNVPKLGNIQFNGKISSSGFSANDPLSINGTISNAQYAGYTYDNIVADAVYKSNRLTATLSLSDSNLAGNFETTLDFNENKQRYNGRGVLLTADLRALGFMKDSLRFSGEFDVDFRGKTIDDFLGYARFYNAEIIAGQTPLSFDSLSLQSQIDTAGNKKLTLQTNEANVAIEGKFNISDLGNGVQYFLHGYYPSIIPVPKKQLVKNQDFYFRVTTKEVEQFLPLIDKRLRGFNNADLTGSINTNTNELLVNADIPYFSYQQFRFSNLSLKGSGKAETLDVLGNLGNMAVNDSVDFPNAELRLNTVRDSTHIILNTSSTGTLGDAAIDAYVYTRPNGFETVFNETSFIINNKKWTINNGGNFAINNGYLTSGGLTLQQDEQSISMFTKPNEEGNWNDIHLAIKNFNAGDLLPYLVKEPRMEGVVSGNVVIADPTGKMHVNTDLRVDHFQLNDDSIGVVNINADYTNLTKKLVADIKSPNKDYDFLGTIKLDLNDSAREQINTVLPLRNVRVDVLKKYLSTVFDDIDGYATGDLRVVGKLKAPSLIGNVMLKQGKLKIGYTKCVYTVDSALLQFGDNYIDFGTLTVKDEKGRKGTVEGRFYHRFFDSLSFNLHMKTDGMQVLNTSGKDNELFFGKAVARATFDLTGPLQNMYIRMTGTPTDSSHIYISNKTTRETGNADFVVFKTYGTEMQQAVLAEQNNFSMDIDLNANQLAKVDVILDEITGDVIKAQGHGNIKIHTGTEDETTMRGRYIIDKGNYDYSFQTLIRKPFILSGDDDNYIEWTGDPEEANLNIYARYLAKKVSMNSLVGTSGSNTTLDNDARNAVGDVTVIAKIKGRLSKPDIDFDIEFASNSELKNNLSAQDMLRRIREDKTELLRQVTYLIVFKSFAPYKEGTVRNPGADLAVNTISDIVSNEMAKILTNVVQRITGDQSLNIDLSTSFYNSSETLEGTATTSSSTYDRVNVGIDLSKAYFKNRVVVNVGSDFDMSVRNTTANGFQFLPDISVEFILTANRRLRAILFKKDNLDIGGRRNRAGASLSYRKDFEKMFGNRDEDVMFVIHKKEKG